MSVKPQVWSNGGGTQSCAIAVLIIQGKLPKPDYAVIADTGREVSYTWEYMEKWVKPALKQAGVELHRIAAGTLNTVDLWSGVERTTAIIPGFSTQDGVPSKLPNYCTNEWKKRPVDRWLRSVGVRDFIKWIGFSRDEVSRVLKMQKSQSDVRFPLVELGMNRRDCIELVKSFGWPTPPRSRCWMCPNQGDHEWRELSKEEFQKAVELEQEIQKVDPCVWLHKSCEPLALVDFSQPEDLFSRPCDSGLCFV